MQKALRHGRPGPYQIQAAIAAVHCAAETADTTDWQEIETLYAALERVQPSPVVSLNRAVALSKVRDAQAGLQYLAPLSETLASYLYFHTTQASLLNEAGYPQQAAAAYERALQLEPTRQEADYIREQMGLCDRGQKNSAPV